jgi:hypothetical protein
MPELKHQLIGWQMVSGERSTFISPYVSIQERAQFEAQGGVFYPAYAGGVRYCPECGSVGPVPKDKRDCCPDGNRAVTVPPEVAEQARAGFQLALGKSRGKV